jgi:RNA polymerase sigma-70 factor, ECF subfamily
MEASFTIRLPAVTLASEDPKNSEALDVREPSDESLIGETGQGSREALSILFRRYSYLVRGVAYRILHDRSEADDLLQDIFLLIHRLRGNFDPNKGSVRSWILQMTYRRALSRRRYLARRHFYSHQELDDCALSFADSKAASQFEDSILERVGKKDIQRLFQKLSENERQALLLRFVEGYELSEIAERMGQSKANIKNHYFRGIEKLRKHIFDGKLTGKRAL